MSWVKEKIAADILDYHPRTLRRKAKEGTLRIAYTQLNGKKYKYAVKDINKILNENATEKQ